MTKESVFLDVPPFPPAPPPPPLLTVEYQTGELRSLGKGKMKNKNKNASGALASAEEALKKGMSAKSTMTGIKIMADSFKEPKNMKHDPRMKEHERQEGHLKEEANLQVKARLKVSLMSQKNGEGEESEKARRNNKDSGVAVRGKRKIADQTMEGKEIGSKKARKMTGNAVDYKVAIENEGSGSIWEHNHRNDIGVDISENGKLAADGKKKRKKGRTTELLEAKVTASAFANEEVKGSHEGSQDALAQKFNGGEVDKALNSNFQESSKIKSSALLDKMRARLQGGQFRMLNEKLYTCRGQEALQFFSKDPDSFIQYHKGYRKQTSQWPRLPVDVVADWLKCRSPSLVVADFGCGDATLATKISNKVFSLDLVASNPSVIGCNMAHTPLAKDSVDVAVFCLSLMGIDYPSYLLEAHRVLKPKGFLVIAEVKSRFDPSTGGAEPADFVAALAALGFRLKSKDTTNKMFLLFVLQKGKVDEPMSKKKMASIDWPTLKACIYKRR